MREGGKHIVFYNPILRRSSTAPRHNKIDYFFWLKKFAWNIFYHTLKKLFRAGCFYFSSPFTIFQWLFSPLFFMGFLRGLLQ